MKTTILLIAVTIVVAAAAQADTIYIEAKGTVIAKTMASGEFPTVNEGDPVILEFSVDPGIIYDDTLTQRGYLMDHASFLLTIGSLEVELSGFHEVYIDPYFLIADDFPDESGDADHFAAASETMINELFKHLQLDVQHPDGGEFYLAFDVAYDAGTIVAPDILPAVGVYGQTDLLRQDFAVRYGMGFNDSINISYSQLTISTSPTSTESGSWSRVKAMYR
jgi:hypothetical protein